jgi:hypothetical protein
MKYSHVKLISNGDKASPNNKCTKQMITHKGQALPYSKKMQYYQEEVRLGRTEKNRTEYGSKEQNRTE